MKWSPDRANGARTSGSGDRDGRWTLLGGVVMVRLTVQVRPGAKKNAVTGRIGDLVKIAVAAPPIEGRANEALVVYLAEALGVPRSRIQVLRGATSRQKVVGIDVAPAVVEAWLAQIG